MVACSWDALLAYSTVKIVRIQDRRVGLVHYAFLLGIVGYIVGFTILFQQRYLLLQRPVGAVRVSLQSPQTRGQVPMAPTALPYCLQAQNETHGFPNRECLYWDENLLSTSGGYSDGRTSMTTSPSPQFVSTRVTQTNQVLPNCSLEKPTCTYVDVNSTEHFVADIGNFTVMVDHSIYAPKVGVLANSRELPGGLLDVDGHTVRDHAEGDSVGVRASSNRSRSLRDDGLVVLVFITYSNTHTYSTGSIRYQYSLRMVENTKFKAVQPIYTKNIENRVIWNRHGIRFIFLQTGELGAFDFATLLLSAVATLVVDVFALHLLKSGRAVYSKYKFLPTPTYHAPPHENENRSVVLRI
ncbi:purinergic receptor, putative [Acanthamoeba castellanii str. Neff]|uniref:Purinergic receptor, putative n=1 Tax=Acanthamoeba castellanii (strain ATCC 30010 / Neff) TaxID=1257118 RepID=L8GQH9_ACACF|nr:purinergic receptor, putative [Acanthamoeba castellanii str. Neff]ELR15132.1 purinergic receptor, putative [Acanthamoeba castellanii str. Neff]